MKCEEEEEIGSPLPSNVVPVGCGSCFSMFQCKSQTARLHMSSASVSSEINTEMVDENMAV